MKIYSPGCWHKVIRGGRGKRVTVAGLCQEDASAGRSYGMNPLYSECRGGNVCGTFAKVLATATPHFPALHARKIQYMQTANKTKKSTRMGRSLKYYITTSRQRSYVICRGGAARRAVTKEWRVHCRRVM